MRTASVRRALSFVAAVFVLCASLCPAPPARAQASQSPQAQDPYAARLTEFEQFVRARLEKDRIPGLVIGFFKDDYTWVKGFGYADLENQTPMIPESAFRLASVTKSMTGEAIVQLAERGKLDLDAEIQTYVPDYPKQKWPVTVRQLLVHTGGGQVGSGLGAESVTTRELVARIAKYPIEVEPGTRYVYTTSGYNLLGAAIENVSGKSFEAYLRENLWLPLGMKDTRIDDVRGLVPHRVRGYDLADGEIKNAPFVDVSSRRGGGGATGTVPDLLRWARGAFAGKVLTPKWTEEMLTPVQTKAGRWVGNGDGDDYYALGWIIKPYNGSLGIRNEGSQKGTDTAVIYFPEKNLAIAAACNLEFAPTYRYVRRLYEIITGEEWEARVYTREQSDTPLALALDNAFNYGALHLARHRRPFTSDEKELAEAFAFFNANASREALKTDFQSTARKLADGRHPVGSNHLIKLGSYIAAELQKKHGPRALDKYHTAGAIPFFNDYVRLYKSGANVPKTLRFTPAFEKLLERWDADWTRTWNDYTRAVALGTDTDFNVVGARLRKEFAGAEVFPDFTRDLQPIQSGLAAFQASKLGADLYPHSDELLFNWGYFIILGELSEPGRAALKQVGGEYERPAAYFKRAHAANPNGVMKAGTFLDLGGRWVKRPEMHNAAFEFIGAGVELHPQHAALRELFADLLLKMGRRDEAADSYRKAFALDLKIGKGATVEEYVAAKMSAAASNE